MAPRKLLLVLVLGLPILVTTFAVLMAGQWLAAGIGDTTSQSALGGVAIGVLVLLAVDLLLLVGALGVNQLESRGADDRAANDRSAEEPACRERSSRDRPLDQP